jgi:hypothetical protein
MNRDGSTLAISGGDPDTDWPLRTGSSTQCHLPRGRSGTIVETRMRELYLTHALDIAQALRPTRDRVRVEHRIPP